MPKQNMVLRSIYLPPGLDNKLKRVAFHKGITKGSLIRKLIESGLDSEVQNSDSRTRAQKSRGRQVAKAGVSS